MRWWLLLLAVLVGCGKPGPSAPKLPPSAFSPSLLVDLGLETAESARDPKFVLIATEPAQARALLWSPDIGLNVGADGTGRGLDGAALPAFVSTGYDAKEDLQAVASPLDISILAAGRPVSPLSSGYFQSLDLRCGLLTTHWFASVPGSILEARLTSLLTGPFIQSRWEFHGPPGLQLTIKRNFLHGKTWTVGAYALVARDVPNDQYPEADSLVSFPQFPGPSARESTAPVVTVTLTSGKATWLAGTMRAGIITAMPQTMRPLWLKRDHKDTAKRAETPDISIDGPTEDIRAIRSFLYYLRSAEERPDPYLDRGQPGAFSPFGLSSNRYNGHVFWDADVWLMPALAFIEPSILQDLADYRATRIRPAQFAPFPWESSVTGKDTAPGESVKEIHISGSVLWGLEFEKALGAKVPDAITKRVADYYLSRATKRPDGKLGLLDVMSPDESHIGANDLYTNLVAQWAINGATWKPASKPAATMYLPSDATSFLTYDHDQLRGYKQAAAVLSIYPLQYPPAEKGAKIMMERFQDKVIPNGPAMSDSIHATIWARLNEPDKAYALWKKSWGEFVKGPLLLFSEKRSSPTTYFTTGAAGCLQSVIYGFLGFRVDEQPEPGAAWKLPLKNGRWLSIKPHLPAAWKSATFRNFRVLGHAYTLTVKREGSKTVTSIKQGV